MIISRSAALGTAAVCYALQKPVTDLLWLGSSWWGLSAGGVL